MTIILYLIKTILISGLLLGYYWLFLRNKSFHRYNRYFLLGIPVISLVFPVLHFGLPRLWNQQITTGPVHLLGVANGGLEEAVTIYAGRGFWKGVPWETGLLAIVSAVSLFLLVRLSRTLWNIRLLCRNNPCYSLQGARVYFIRQEGTPFSFFNHVFWNNEQDLESSEGRQILKHELLHVKQMHSLDILILEMIRICCWINPFIHLILVEIRAVHEFEADAHAASDRDLLDYAELLLENISGPKSQSLVHPFFQKQIKRRINMITIRSKKIRNSLTGRMMILPVITLLLALFAFKITSHPLHLLSVENHIRVVVDAGHGGTYPGITSNGIREKDLNLQIAKKIQQLAKDFQIDIIMTREDDDLPGRFNNLHDDLQYRASLAVKTNADLFVSIHSNSNDGEKPEAGFEIYVPEKTSPVYPGSVKLGSAITEYIGKDYAVAPELKQREKGILVLNQATVPAVMILCGNLEKKSDFDFIMDYKNQEKIARDILKGITLFSQQTTSHPYGSTGQVGSLNPLPPDKPDQTTDDIRKSRKNSDSASQTGPPFTKVEFEAEYPGGARAWSKYLQQNLKYPDEAAKNEIQGTVLVQFIVEKDGTVSNITIISGPDVLKAESIRIIRDSGKWKPAKQNRHIVRSYHRQPIHYVLEHQ